MKRKLETEKRDFILEIGAEELPSTYIERARRSLLSMAKSAFDGSMVEYKSIEAFATPRRLVLFVRELSDRQATEKELKKGPSVEISFDENGKPTDKLSGFMKRFGLRMKDIKIKNEKGKKYVFGSVTKNRSPRRICFRVYL